jgi:tetraacyldisaccharide 4'-kinase
MVTAAGSIYGRVTEWRRQWYARDPSRQRHLSRPVISIGSLRAGGAGKTPLVATIAGILSSRGHRPAILTRGYARRVTSDGVTVVSDGQQILAALATAGDEALMLARALKGVAVLAGADRYLSGCLAESRFRATTHLLDDGFQHVSLARDVDLLVVDRQDLTDDLLPVGPLREPISAAFRAHALLTAETDPVVIEHLKDTLAVQTVFRISRTLGTPHLLHGEILPNSPVFAIAGIARPQRFFDDLAASGWQVAGTMTFPDHHQFSASDMSRVFEAARRAGAGSVVTTEKDAVRLELHQPRDRPIVAVPLNVVIEAPFVDWLFSRDRLGDHTA